MDKKNNPFKGHKHTEESRKKMREAKLGKPSKRKRKVTINGIEYESITEARIKLNIGTKKLYKILKENENE